MDEVNTVEAVADDEVVEEQEITEQAEPQVITTDQAKYHMDFIYTVKDIMKEHSLTWGQAMYLMSTFYGIDCELSGADALSLVNKGLIKNNKINQTLLFRTRPVIQGTLDLNFETKPKGTVETLRLADNLETRFVPPAHLDAAYRKSIADEYFKGDLSVARYFIIFKHLFPVKDVKLNNLWNRHFGFIYGGITLWDPHVRVAKKFLDIYRKRDIGLFLSGCYYKVVDSLDVQTEKCFMTKPYKFLEAYEAWYEVAETKFKEKMVKEAAAKVETTQDRRSFEML